MNDDVYVKGNKYQLDAFDRPDAQHVDDKTLMPDVKINLGDKDKAWEQILLMCQQ